MESEIRPIKIVVVPKGEKIFNERATEVEIIDDAAGEFVRIIQSDEAAEVGTIQIDPAEWPILRKAIDRMVRDCRNYE
jgi:hypothetical protein